ncbi:MerR family transcriptional regulator [Savagea sp. SN6]|uniref:MerR family transcriptional regulator n=1 Tax=Savagea serpentis TaxID=2785297 RepID=A0A8J7KS97_9BACL|nr:MerR family transcriptional regulator [Savagea serpentis]MBF4500334.1 MerR family transcriptional regulator [Savagea serpentis]
MKDKGQFFTTGEFAKACGISKQTIIYYDKIGLLQPDFIEKNGYRYYSVHQLERFAVIDLLKRLDTPLKEIKQFLNEKELEEAVRLLEEKEQVLIRKMEELSELQQIIRTKRALIQEAGQVVEEVFIEQMEAECLIVSEPIIATSEKEISERIQHFAQYFVNNERDAGYPMSRLFSKEQFEKGDYVTGGCFYIRVEEPKTNCSVMKEAGTYACTYHVGDYNAVTEAYERIKRWMEAEQYIVAGDVYEQYMLDEIISSNTEQYVTKMMVRVIKR